MIVQPDQYAWFDDVHVEQAGPSLCCIVDGKRVPFPVEILHPDCTLSQAGDVGRLGVPVKWAIEQGLLPDTSED